MSASAEPLLGFSFAADDLNTAWMMGVVTLLGLGGFITVIFLSYAVCCATPEGHAMARLTVKSGRVVPYEANDSTEKVYAALDPYFTDGAKGGRKLLDGDFHDDQMKNANGLPENKLVAGKYHKEEALRLLTRGIDAHQMVDKNGIYKAGADDLQKDPLQYYSMSQPTKRIKAFISHTWDAKDFNPSTVAADRAEHADKTTKAIMWHLKFRPMFVATICSQIGVAFVFTAFPVLYPFAALVVYGVPLWVVSTRSTKLFRFLGLCGPQFWMDKVCAFRSCCLRPMPHAMLCHPRRLMMPCAQIASWQATVHQANLQDGDGSAGFKFVPPNVKMSDAERAQQTSKYRVLNQAGVGLFDHFLTSSDELWVLFIDRYMTRVWCVYELAYWLRLMRTDSRRKIKLIPVERNAKLYYKHPGFQGLVAWATMAYLGLALYAASMNHMGGDAFKSSGETMSYLLMCGGCCYVVALGFVLQQYYQIILPAKAKRAEIARELKSFSVVKTQASFPEDKKLVLGMIATMWRKAAGLSAGASDDDCLKAFDEEVRTSVAPKLDGLLKQTETDLLRMYMIIITIAVGTGAPFIPYALDLLRPAAAPRLAFWVNTEFMTAMGMGAAAIVITTLLMWWIQNQACFKVSMQ